MVVVTDGAQDGQLAFRINGLLDGDAAHEFFRFVGADLLFAVCGCLKREVEIDVSKIGDEIRICFFSSLLREEKMHLRIGEI